MFLAREVIYVFIFFSCKKTTKKRVMRKGSKNTQLDLTTVTTSEEDLTLEEKKRVPAFKVILVGDMTVGKTSLITRFTDHSFSEDVQRTPALGSNLEQIGKQ